MDDICKCYDTEFIESMFQRAGQLQSFHLSEAEVNTLKAVILLFTGTQICWHTIYRKEICMLKMLCNVHLDKI